MALTANDFALITPNDGADLAFHTKGIYVGTGGTITVRNRAGNDILFTGIPDGSILPVRTIRVMATGTTATGLVALDFLA